MRLGSRAKYTLALGILVPAILLALLLSLRQTIWRISSDFFHPFLSGIGVADSALSHSSIALLPRRELVSRLHHSERRIAELEAENSMLENLKSENSELREILGIPPPHGFRPVYCEISVRDPFRWNETFTVDKGYEDGIRPGCIALSFSVTPGCSRKYAVAGRVVSASRHSSIVETVAGPRSSFGTYLPDLQIPAIAEEGFCDRNQIFFRAKYLPRDLGYPAGLEITTSPFSPEIPPFLPVGAIVEEEEEGAPGSEKLSKSAICFPFADLRKTRFLVVLVKK